VTFTESVTVAGTVTIHSTDNQAQTVTTTQSAIVELDTPTPMTPIVAALPSGIVSTVLTPTGTGATGTVNASISDTKSATYDGTTAFGTTVLNTFTGIGNVNSPIWSLGGSAVTGSGNLDATFASSASGTVTVVYTYTPMNTGHG